jgi:hypothetical protein
MKKCKNCLLPAKAPGGSQDQRGLCNACRTPDERNRETKEAVRLRHVADLEKALHDCRGKGEYDCLLLLSGGKDSCCLLHKLKVEYGLNVLTLTVEPGVNPLARENIKRTVEKLDVAHLFHTPAQAFYRKLFRWLLQNQEERGAVRSVCSVCSPLKIACGLRLAVEKKIPLVLAGFSAGQPDSEWLDYEFSRETIRRTDWTPDYLRASGHFSKEELSVFWNPLRYPAGTSFPRFLAPYHAWEYNQEFVMKKVVELGLIANRRQASPVRTNCALNWLLMYSDLKHLGYNPYAPEFSALIRDGKANRNYWRLLAPLVDFMIQKKTFLGRAVKENMRWLGLQDEDLKITRPPQPPHNVSEGKIAAACASKSPSGICECAKTDALNKPVAAVPK